MPAPAKTDEALQPRAAAALQMLRGLLAARHDHPADDFELTTRSLSGGLMADLLCVSATRPGARPEQFVLKRVGTDDLRESDAYGALARCGLDDIAPRLISTSRGGDASYLVLEYVSRWKPWPWRDEALAAKVIDTLARLHDAPIAHDWQITSYEGDLRLAAAYALDLLRTAIREFRDQRLGRGLRFAEALAARLPEARALLLADAVFLHGDVHPGNVVVRSDGGSKRAVLLDWGRARAGSRFEDVASWLQCLRYFEHTAIATHDRLLLRYIRAARLGDRITAAHRREYWIAAGCNALAGALGVHLSRALGATTATQRAAAIAAAADWLRITRRAVAHLEGWLALR